MSRFPRVRFDTEMFSNVDAIYLTHGHCDHLDPYTLIRFWNDLESPPALIIPVSLSFLVPIFERYLNCPDIIVLKPHVTISFAGLELLGFFDVSDQPNNEEDVMVLVVTNHNERVLVEADARLSLELIHFRQFVSMLLRAPNLDTVVYLTTENELTGTMEGRNCSSVEDREELLAYATEEMYTSIEHLYIPFDDPMDLWKDNRLIRLIHGQGLTAPHALDERWHKILFPVRIEHRIQAEREIAKQYGYAHSIDGLTVGHTHTIVRGVMTNKIPISGYRLLDQESQRGYECANEFFPNLPCAPLRAYEGETEHQKRRLESLLNDFFVPYLHGVRQPPVLHLLSENDGEYRIHIHYGSTLDSYSVYILSFAHPIFVESASSSPPHEAYWANDLIDFLEGMCDEFSTFCRRQIPAPYMRLWTALATPLLNSERAQKRIERHFERASKGYTPDSWVLEYYSTEESQTPS